METVTGSQASDLQKFAPTGVVNLEVVETGMQVIPDIPVDKQNLKTSHWWWYPLAWIGLMIYLLMRKRGK